MGTGTVVLIIVGIAALIAIATVIGLRNGIVAAKNRAKRAWADVIAYERKKLKVIPALEQGLKNHQAYELGVFKDITALRASVAGLSPDKLDTSRLEEVERQSRSLVSSLKVAVEAYPMLKTSELYAGWMKELAEAEENIAAAIVIFNFTVQGFNDRIQMFPGNLVNSLLNNELPLAPFSDSEAEGEIEYRPNFTS